MTRTDTKRVVETEGTDEIVLEGFDEISRQVGSAYSGFVNFDGDEDPTGINSQCGDRHGKKVSPSYFAGTVTRKVLACVGGDTFLPEHQFVKEERHPHLKNVNDGVVYI
uniref:Uncharacterized protein n=1 Tax=Oryza sativa subsp. japonica TaxID=39947 RepID=Q6YTH4_ORYSJ|nr:hypothetical protein [Oryza sativa Japonica Group]